MIATECRSVGFDIAYQESMYNTLVPEFLNQKRRGRRRKKEDKKRDKRKRGIEIKRKN